MTREEFRQIRLELGLTQQALADRIGLRYQQNINSIENGDVGISGPVAAHMRTLIEHHREYLKNMTEGRR